MLFTRHAGSSLPCPPINFTAFNEYYAAVYGLDPAPAANSIQKKFGAHFDPFLNDETYTTSVLALEELGCTGNKVRTGQAAVLLGVVRSAFGVLHHVGMGHGPWVIV